MSVDPIQVDTARRGRPRLTPVALALWSIAEGGRLSSDLHAAGVPVMLLKGPRLQERLYGTPARYVSSDIDVLVPRARAKAARSALHRAGWVFEPENGVLWFVSAAASFVRDGFRADLHWGLHAAHLPAFTLRSLERELWRGATVGPDGFLVPDDESLFVYLAVHAAGHEFERAHWVENVYAAAERVHDWARVWRIAGRARVAGAVRAAMGQQDPGTKTPILDGAIGRAIWFGTYALRGHVLPRDIRDRLREFQAMRREGFGVRRGAPRLVEFHGLLLEIDAGVFDPQDISARMLSMAEQESRQRSPAVIVDMGTGSGVMAFLAAAKWPDAAVCGVDVSARAVACARRNAQRLEPRVRFARGSLLDGVPDPLIGAVDLLFSNIPYVSPATGRDPGAWRVPANTIFGPENDGLGLMRKLAEDLPRLMVDGGLWVFQIGDSQWDGWSAYLEERGYETIEPSERRPGGAVVAAARTRGPTQ